VLIKKSELCKKLSVSTDGLRKIRRKDSSFPAPLKLGDSKQSPVFFVKEEIEKWLETKKAERFNFPGTWIKYPSSIAQFKIRPANNPEYIKSLEQLRARSDGMDSFDAGKDFAELVGKYLIQDWKDIIFIEDGQEFQPPYTLDNAVKLFLMGDSSLEIFRWVRKTADSLAAEGADHD